MRAPDAYRILRVSADSDAAAVRRSYRSLVKQFHPDLSGGRGNAARLDKIIEAYRFLCDHGYLPDPPKPAAQAKLRRKAAPQSSADRFRLVDLLIAGETPEARAFAAQRLGGMGRKWAVAFLKNALNDPSEVVVKSAVGALGQLGASRCAGELASIFYRGNAELRHTVLDAVERSATPDAFAGIVLEALRADEPEVRRRALRLFAQAKREEVG